MNRSAQRQLRAYVLPDQATLADGTMLNPPQPERANVPGAFMSIKNSGQTPAYKVTSWARITVIPVREENTLVLPVTLPEQFFNTLGREGFFSKTLWLDRPLAANEIADVANGTRAVYLYGTIVYRDAFNKKRHTNFRLRYNGQFPPVQGVIFNFSEGGNDAN